MGEKLKVPWLESGRDGPDWDQKQLFAKQSLKPETGPTDFIASVLPNRYDGVR